MGPFVCAFLVLLFRSSIADIQIQNGDASQEYYVQFYVQGVDGSACGWADQITDVQIWSPEHNAWVRNSQYELNKNNNGDFYIFDCAQQSPCSYPLPISILLSTETGANAMTLTHVISAFTPWDVFTTHCQLCKGVQTCLPPTPPPTPYPTRHPSLSPTHDPSRAPTPSPTQIPSRSPTHVPSPSPTRAPSKTPTVSPSAQPTNSLISLAVFSIFVHVQNTCIVCRCVHSCDQRSNG